ncbi:MAG: alkaline phosphatase [Oscillospiraceae bacterium]|nr:alkaline phosphatase [Oscillospiraceae bacterium]
MHRRKKYIKLFFAVFVVLTVISAGLGMRVLYNGRAPAKPPKYIFLFIADGCSSPQVALASLYKTSVLKEDDLILNSFKIFGNAYTQSGNSMIPDSAAAASAIAGGINADNGYLNMDANGVKYETIAEKLKNQLGYKIGIISSDNLNHATPAGFYAHQESRYGSAEIFLELAASGFDYFGGGDILAKGAVESVTGKPFIEILSDFGYRYINTEEDLENLGSVSADGKVVAVSPALDLYATIPFAIDKEKYSKSFTIARHTKKCAEFLYKDNPAGFFIMVEGEKTDWACHSNDAATLIHEMIDFDDAVREAVEFYNKHPGETLIIVTADHETGGLSLGYSETTSYMHLEHLANQKISFSEFSFKIHAHRQNETAFEDILPEIKEYFGIAGYDGENPHFYFSGGDMEKLRAAYDMSMIDPSIRAFGMSEYVAYGFYDPLTTTIIKIINRKARVSWSTYSHTALPVFVLALGNGEENFAGFYKNSEIFAKLKTLMKLE